MERTTEKIPTWALCYLINSDPTGLTDEDIRMIDEWYERNKVTIVCTASDLEGNCNPYFTHYPAFGLPTDVIDCDVLTR